MPKRGRLESRYTLTSAWEATFTDTSGAIVVSVPAGNYYLYELLNTGIVADLDVDWSIEIAFSESSNTGKTTISSVNTPWSVTWTSTDLRDALGFTANISNVSVAQTGTKHCHGLWLPDVPKITMYGDEANGSLITDFRATKSPTGVIQAFFGNSYRVHEGIRWEGVSAARAMEHQESVDNESYEVFMTDILTGRKSYIPVAAPVRLYWDADNELAITGRLDAKSRFDVGKVIESWNGRYIVELPPLVIES